MFVWIYSWWPFPSIIWSRSMTTCPHFVQTQKDLLLQVREATAFPLAWFINQRWISLLFSNELYKDLMKCGNSLVKLVMQLQIVLFFHFRYTCFPKRMTCIPKGWERQMSYYQIYENQQNSSNLLGYVLKIIWKYNTKWKHKAHWDLRFANIRFIPDFIWFDNNSLFL